MKQTLRAWSRRIDIFFINHGFKICSVEHGVYVKYKQNEMILLIYLYVDELLITIESQLEIKDLKSTMKSEFEIPYMGNLSYFFGMEFLYKEGGKILHQTKYATDLLKRFNMLNCNDVVTSIELGQKLEEDNDEEWVDATLYKQMI